MSQIIVSKAVYEAVYGEDHSDECNGSRTTFYTAKVFKPLTVKVWFNGLLQRPIHYREDVLLNSITLYSTPIAGDELILDYMVK